MRTVGSKRSTHRRARVQECSVVFFSSIVSYHLGAISPYKLRSTNGHTIGLLGWNRCTTYQVGSVRVEGSALESVSEHEFKVWCNNLFKLTCTAYNRVSEDYNQKHSFNLDG